MWHPERRKQELCKCLETGSDRGLSKAQIHQDERKRHERKTQIFSSSGPRAARTGLIVCSAFLESLPSPGHDSRLKAGAGDGIHARDTFPGQLRPPKVLPWGQNPHQGCEIWKFKLTHGQWNRSDYAWPSTGRNHPPQDGWEGQNQQDRLFPARQADLGYRTGAKWKKRGK